VQWGCIGMVVPNKAAAVQTTNNIFVAAIADTIDGGGTPSRHHHRSKTAPLLTHPDFDTVWRKRPPTLTRSHTLRTETDKFRCHHRHRTEHHTRRTEENIGWCDYKSITHNIYNTYVDGSVNALHRYIRNCDGCSERRTCQLLLPPGRASHRFRSMEGSSVIRTSISIDHVGRGARSDSLRTGHITAPRCVGGRNGGVIA